MTLLSAVFSFCQLSHTFVVLPKVLGLHLFTLPQCIEDVAGGLAGIVDV